MFLFWLQVMELVVPQILNGGVDTVFVMVSNILMHLTISSADQARSQIYSRQ